MTAAAAGARRTHQPVRRDSFDVDDPRAQVFRPIEGGFRFVGPYLEVFDEWADLIKQKGRQHELNQNCRKVLHRLLTRCTDFKTGICEPCLDTLMKHTRLARATVVRALALLSKHGWLDWVRRTIRTDLDPGEGPQVKQASNAYFFDLSRLPRRALARLRQKLRKRQVPVGAEQSPRVGLFTRRARRRGETVRARRADLAASLAGAVSLEAKAAVLYPGSPADQAAWLELQGGEQAGSASSGSSLNPSSSTEREAD